jgi:hypothetical protein
MPMVSGDPVLDDAAGLAGELLQPASASPAATTTAAVARTPPLPVPLLGLPMVRRPS